ncbi:hypothetical protein A5647_15770 [Mycobacterium sp. 1100029.7]|nr:hypothetical protein A5647_15770 [Mycobacterium sp. 1100029.7]
MADPSSRRRLLITSVLMSVGVLIAAGVGVEASGPARADSDFTPPHDCGNWNDSGPRLDLWKDIKDASPQNPKPGVFIFVNDSWALKNGNYPGEKYKYNLLAIPRARVTGVECADIWGPKAFNLWKPAWDDAINRFKGSVDVSHVMLGVNSKPGRQQDQLHIHLTSFQQQARRELDALKGISADVSKWSTSMYTVMGHVYRIVRVNDLDANVFKLVKDNISQNDMFEQSIAVVAGPGGKGFYILNTQGQPKLPGEPQHNPQLHVGGAWGTESIEDLIYRG